MPLMAGLRCSLDLLEDEGSAENRQEKIQRLSEPLWEKLKTRSTTSPLLNGPSAAGLVSLSIETGPDIATTTEVVKWLGKQKTWIRDLADLIYLRACTHICTSEEEIDKIDNQLGELQKKQIVRKRSKQQSFN